jgi:hypothetical protein
MSTVAAAGDDIQLAELRDRDLFTQPDSSHLGDCPICCLPLSLDQSKATFMGCCSKTCAGGVNTPTPNVRMKRGWSNDVHSAESPHQNRMKSI